MKKIKYICSAIAALFMLALAGCDLEIPENLKPKMAVAEYSVDALPYVVQGYVPQDAVLYPLDELDDYDVESDGLSLSFYLSGYTSDWSMIFQVPSSNWGTTTMHECSNKTWVSNSFGNASGNGAWDQFNNVNCYVTISMNYDDGTMTYYKNGEQVTVYGGETSPYGFASWGSTSKTGKEWVRGILDDILTDGIYCIHPSDSWANASAGSYTMQYFVVDKEVDAEGAVEKYNTAKAYIGF